MASHSSHLCSNDSDSRMHRPTTRSDSGVSRPKRQIGMRETLAPCPSELRESNP
jgi:hypothetical protein